MALEDAGPLIRIATMRALPDRRGELIAAAQSNAHDASAAEGCRSAEVYADPDDAHQILVISRWESGAALRAFLTWHEGHAHSTIAPAAAEKPHAVHYPALPLTD